jgi:uncharacterized protein YegL
MRINTLSQTFSGEYGSSQDVGDIISTQITVREQELCQDNKEVIFLIDISGSMEESMKQLKASLLAFRDNIIGKTPTEMERISEQDRDQLFRNAIRARLITFSNEAEEVWSNNSSYTFEHVVLSLQSKAMTNMGDALKLAFKRINRHVFSWVILMTDGESNEGPCRTAGSFQRLVTSSKPLNTKIISLGYGNHFDPDVLNRVGIFVYLEDPERIPVVLGNIAEEIITAVGFNCVVDVSESSEISELTDDTIIVAAGEDDKIPGKTIVGNRVMGTLCSGKIYNHTYLPHGNTQSSELLGTYEYVTIRYTDIASGDEIVINQPIVHLDANPPDRIKNLFFTDKKRELIYNIYKALQKCNNSKIQKEISYVKNILKYWTCDISDSHKDELLKMLQDIEFDKYDDRRKTNTTLNYAAGNGYSTLSDDNYASSTLSATRYYMLSPLINNN